MYENMVFLLKIIRKIIFKLVYYNFRLKKMFYWHCILDYDFILFDGL